jgi:hypothetical protein
MAGITGLHPPPAIDKFLVSETAERVLRSSSSSSNIDHLPKWICSLSLDRSISVRLEARIRELSTLADDCQPSTLNVFHRFPQFVERNANSRTYKNPTVKGPSSAVPSASPTPTVLLIATLLLSIMLSRFSSLFTYVILGLVVSAAATPLNPLGDALGDGTKSLSRPHAMKSNDKGKPYGGDKSYGDKAKSYGDKDKPYDGKDKPYDDKDKSYDDKDKPYGDKDKHYGDDRSESYGQCSVGNQHCCNQVNQVNHIHFVIFVASLLTYCSRRLRLPSSSLSVLASWDLPISSA